MRLEVYNKKMERKYANLPIEIISTGSQGNSVFIEPINLLIDVGVPYKKYQEKTLQKIKYIMLTHKHGDHYKPTTIKKMLNVYPIIKLYVPSQMVAIVQNEKWYDQFKNRIYEINEFEKISLNKTYTAFDITNYPTKHGEIINAAYDIEIPTLKTKILYASDLEYATANPFQDMKYQLPQKNKYNLIMLEANYDNDIIEKKIDAANKRLLELNELQLKVGYNVKDINDEIRYWNNFIFRNQSNFRHLEESEAIDYAISHLTNAGLFIPLHASRDNGSYHLKIKSEDEGL